MLQRLLLHLLTATVAVAALGLGSPWLGAAAADIAHVTVVKPDGAKVPLALDDELADLTDVVDVAYTLRSATAVDTKTVTGFSLGTILEAANIPSFTFSYLEVQGPEGESVELTNQEATDKGVFADGPPVVYATPSGTGFIRPNAGKDDLNGDESFEGSQGLQLVLHKDPKLQVRAKATPQRVEPGEEVNLSAIVEGARPGEELTFSWTFYDGSPRRVDAGDSIPHRFAKAGPHKVVVGVTGAGNRSDSDIVTVQVGEPTKGGPDRKGGGTNKDENAPDHGAATGPATGTGGESGSASIPPPPVESFPPPTEPFPEPEPEPLPQPEPVPAPEPEGEPVTGILLEEGGTAAPEPETGAEEEPAAARTGTLSEKGSGDGGGLPDAAIGFVITGALLGAGGLIEARNLLR